MFTTAEKTLPLLKSKYLKAFIRYEGIQRIEELEYPEKALREAILNSIVHKDYTGSYIQMRVYNTGLSIWNSGTLPEQISIESLMGKHTSIPRNRTIANLFFRAGYIEAWGRGMSIIFNECNKANLPKPLVKEEFGGFTIEFYRERKDDDSVKVTDRVTGRVTGRVTDNQEMILQLIENNSLLSTSELANLVGISQRKIKENISKLKEMGILKRIGPAKGGHWQITKP